MKVLAGMDLIGEINTVLVRIVEDRQPALCELVEGSLDEAGRTLRPGIDIGPGQRAGEGRLDREPQASRRANCALDLVDSPLGACPGIAAHLRHGEAIECCVISRMHGDELTLKMGREFGDGKAVFGRYRLHLIGIVLGLRRLLEVEEPPVPARDLNPLVTERGSPFADRVQGVEWRRIGRELSEEYRRSLDHLHLALPSSWTLQQHLTAERNYLSKRNVCA